jgi:hypothetical protein
MTNAELSQLINAFGKLRSDRGHITHFLNCRDCGHVMGNLSELVTSYINQTSEIASLKVRLAKYESEEKTLSSSSLSNPEDHDRVMR